MTQRTGACPRCSRARLGFLRYCIDCGFDYDAPASTTQASIAPPPHAGAPGSPVLPRSAALLGAPLPPAPPRTILPPAPPSEAAPPAPMPVAAPRRYAMPALAPRAAVPPAPVVPSRPAEPPAPPDPRPEAPPPARPAARPILAAPPAAPAAPRQVTTTERVRPVVQPRRPGRQRLLGQLALVAVAIVLGVTALSTALLPATDAGRSTPPTTAGSVGPGTTLPVSGASPTVGLGPTGQTQSAIVTGVVDGDTIRVRLGSEERDVRYIGIDTPEPDDVDPVTRALAEVAKAQNAAMVDGRTVLLEQDVSETDEFDRLLRHVWLEADGAYVLVNLELVRMGLAQVATYPPDVRYASDFRAAQALARRAGAGIWRASAEPSAPVTINDGLFYIEPGSRERFEGGAGAYRWTALAFLDRTVIVRWIATAPTDDACAVTWTFEPTSGAEVTGSIDVPHAGQETGNRDVTIPSEDAALAVSSTCQSWALAIEG